MHIAKLHQTEAALVELDQTALAEAAETSAGRLLDQIDREVQQADFLRIIDALDDRAEWLAGFFHLRSGLSIQIDAALSEAAATKLYVPFDHGCFAGNGLWLLMISSSGVSLFALPLKIRRFGFSLSVSTSAFACVLITFRLSKITCSSCI